MPANVTVQIVQIFIRGNYFSAAVKTKTVRSIFPHMPIRSLDLAGDYI